MTTCHQRHLDHVRQSFEANTAKHELTVLMDRSTDPDDPQPYRHLRIAEPGTRIYSWDIITWPGHLATAGDIADGYTFARVHDMVDFFEPVPEPYRINPSYWAEKLAHSQREGIKKFSLPSLLEAVDSDIVASIEAFGVLENWEPQWVELLTKSAHREISTAVEFSDAASSAEAAYGALRAYEYSATSLEVDLRLHANDLTGQRIPRPGGLQPFSFDRNGDAYELMSNEKNGTRP